VEGALLHRRNLGWLYRTTRGGDLLSPRDRSGANMRQLLRPLLLAVLLFSIQATLLAPWVEKIRTDTGIAYEQVAGLEVPADIRILEGALGSFRGWLINFLWLRAGQLQEENRNP